MRRKTGIHMRNKKKHWLFDGGHHWGQIQGLREFNMDSMGKNT